jgi:hypothetical protein
LSSSSNKKVLVTRFDRDTVPGFVRLPESFLPDGLDLLTLAGSVMKLPYADVKVVSFVRDLDGGEAWKAHRTFASRPKTPGLWIKLVFRDGDTVEGILANNLLLMEPTGFQLIPPDPTFQNQRIFVPKEALREAHVLGVMGARPRRKPAGKPPMGDEEQLEMFS